MYDVNATKRARTVGVVVVAAVISPHSFPAGKPHAGPEEAEPGMIPV